MRKQYHFRRSDRGLASWDVHRLLKLARNLPRLMVRLDEIKALVQGLGSIEAVRFTVDPEPDFVGRKASELPY